MARSVFRKPQIEAYALEYARRALRKGCPSGPAGLESMTHTAQWESATPQQRSDVCNEIKAIARKLLVQNGYSREIVYQRIIP